MAYSKTTWADRIDSGNKYSITDNGDGTSKIEYAGTVTQEGTPVNAENLNHMEQGIEDAHSAVSDLSTQTGTALNGKQDKEEGKGLSSNDFTDSYKSKLDNVDTTVTEDSENLITSGAVFAALAGVSGEDINALKNMLYPRIVVVGTSGTSFTLTKGTRTISGTVGSDGTAEVLVPELGDWTLSKDGDTSTITFDAPMTCKVKAPALADCTPTQIQAVARSGQASNVWSVGDKTSAITLNGTVGALTFSNETVYAFILGFNHNASIEGSNSIHFGLGMTSGGTKIAFCDSSYASTISTSGFNMNTSYTNTGGWNGSQMRTNIMPAIKNALPSAWRSVIASCTKYSDNTGGGSNTASYVTSTTDYIFLLSEYEVQGTRTYANSAEQNKQKQYDYFKNGNSKICYKHNDTSSACLWWCRSVYATNSSTFCLVATNGTANYNSANNSRGVFSAFKVA